MKKATKMKFTVRVLFNTFSSLIYLVAVMLFCQVPVSAHHAFSSEFSVDSPVEFTGKVTKVEMINPHSWIYIDVMNELGIVEEWMIEGGSPNALFRQGITRNTIPIGSELSVVGYQARDGGNRAVGRTIQFSNGEPLFFSGTRVPDTQASE